MGVALAHFRKTFLIFQKANLEFKIMTITQARMGLMNVSSELTSIGNDLDPESPELRLLNKKQERIKLIEQKLDMQLERYQTKLQSIETEMDSVEKLKQAGIKRAFTYGIG